MVWRWPWRSVGVGVKFHCAVGYLTTVTGQPSIRSALQQYSYLCPHPHTHPQPLTQGMLATCWRVSFIFRCNGHSRIGHVRFWFCSTLCTTRAHISLSAFVISLQPLLARHLHTRTHTHTQEAAGVSASLWQQFHFSLCTFVVCRCANMHSPSILCLAEKPPSIHH